MPDGARKKRAGPAGDAGRAIWLFMKGWAFMELSFRLIDRGELAGFRQYLLPATAEAIERDDESVVALGAVSGAHSVAAAAIMLSESGDVSLTDLFVDETARRQGVGTYLLFNLLEDLEAIGVDTVTADYTLRGEELEAMDKLLKRLDFEDLRVRSRTFMAHSRDYKDHPLIGRAFRPDWRPPEGVVAFSELSSDALRELEQAKDMPSNLSVAMLKGRLEPELSVALVMDGRVIAYLLGEESSDGGFVLLSAVSREGAPATAFSTLLTDLINRCYYWRGGEFPFYFSAINEHNERLARGIMRGKCVEYEEHVCVLKLGSEDEEDGGATSGASEGTAE